LENLKARDHFGGLVDGRIILKSILNALVLKD
jgi:hypothetical protein